MKKQQLKTKKAINNYKIKEHTAFKYKIRIKKKN